MAKTIKVEEQEYQKLDEIKEKGETFAQVIQRLLDIYAMVFDLSKRLGPSHYLQNVERYLAIAKKAVKR